MRDSYFPSVSLHGRNVFSWLVSCQSLSLIEDCECFRNSAVLYKRLGLLKKREQVVLRRSGNSVSNESSNRNDNELVSKHTTK